MRAADMKTMRTLLSVLLTVLCSPCCLVAQTDSLVEAGCGTGFKPFDRSQLLFDSCFRASGIKGYKSCHIDITDSMFIRTEKESIEVNFDEEGRPVKLMHVFGNQQKMTCAEITCTYGDTWFYSQHMSYKEPLDAKLHLLFRRADNRYREETDWSPRYGVNDTAKLSPSKRRVYSNIAGKDSCIQFTSPREKSTMLLSKSSMLNDSTEFRIYKYTSGGSDTSDIELTITYNQRKQQLRREQYSQKGRTKSVSTFQYDADGRLIRYTYSNNAGDAEGFTISRNKAGLPVRVRCAGLLYFCIYTFKWNK